MIYPALCDPFMDTTTIDFPVRHTALQFTYNNINFCYNILYLTPCFTNQLELQDWEKHSRVHGAIFILRGPVFIFSFIFLVGNVFTWYKLQTVSVRVRVFPILRVSQYFILFMREDHSYQMPAIQKSPLRGKCWALGHTTVSFSINLCKAYMPVHKYLPHW